MALARRRLATPVTQDGPATRCPQVAPTLLRCPERDGTERTAPGSIFVSNSAEMSSKVTFRKGFLREAPADSIPDAATINY